MGSADNIAFGIWQPDCKLIVQHGQIRADKLTKPRKVVLTITSPDEGFELSGSLNVRPFIGQKVKVNVKKKTMKISVIVSAKLHSRAPARSR